MKLLHQARKWVILMLDAVQHCLPHSRKELPERQSFIKLRSQGYHVDEVAHHIAELSLIATVGG